MLPLGSDLLSSSLRLGRRSCAGGSLHHNISPLSKMTLTTTRGIHTFLAESRLLVEVVFFAGAATFLAGAFLASVFFAAGAAFTLGAVLVVVAFLGAAALAGLADFSLTTFSFLSFFSFFSLGATAFLAAFGFSFSTLEVEAFAFAGFVSGLF